MPQFDIFSFFSQLFWVFLAFTFLFLVLSLYLLPAIAAILKTRKRKLEYVTAAETNSLASSASLVNSQIIHVVSFIDTLVTFKIKTVANNNAPELQLLTLKSLSSRKFCLGLFNNIELSTLLYS
jgi:hypothetical protein